MYALGARRRSMGTRPATIRDLIGHARQHFGTRAGSALSD
jgi:hypothetical protein